MLELLKIIVQPVVLERDDDGHPLGERLGEATAFYDADSVAEYIEAIRGELQAANAQTFNGGKEELHVHKERRAKAHAPRRASAGRVSEP
jgi:hypothetical protein